MGTGTLCGLALISGCGDGATAPEPRPDRQIELVSPATLDAGVGTSVALTVEVRENGTTLPGVAVHWEPDSESGSVAPESATTDALGRARATWQLGIRAGTQTLTVRAEGADDFLLTPDVRAGPAQAVRLEADTLLLTARRERRTVEPRFEDAYGNRAQPPDDIAWSSLDPAVASVDPEDPAGIVTARGRGSTRVFLESGVGGAEVEVAVDFRGVITVTFDDGFRTTHSRAFPILEALDLRANVAVVTRSAQEAWADFLTVEQLQDLHGAGWAMVSHTVTHPNLTELSDAGLEEELLESREWLEEQGFRGAAVFIVPFLDWDDRVRSAVAAHYEMARGTSSLLIHPDTLSDWMPDDPYALTGLDADSAPFQTEEGRETIRAFLERAVEEGLFFELFFHRIEEDDEEAFHRTMEMLAELRNHVVTWDEVADRFRSSREGGRMVAAGPPARGAGSD